jgi:hypothetical protein
MTIMTRADDNLRRWRITLGDTFILMTGVGITISLAPYFLSLGAPTAYEFKALYTGSATFVASVGYMMARLDGVNTRMALMVGVLGGVTIAATIIARSQL